tara:strand:+ start:880 stop:1254 length:375 start_codon:yes stop_codon:yes gene_type:complete
VIGSTAIILTLKPYTGVPGDETSHFDEVSSFVVDSSAVASEVVEELRERAKCFCACERICAVDLVPTYCCILDQFCRPFFRSESNNFIAYKNRTSSSSVHVLRPMVLMYGFRLRIGFFFLRMLK